MKRLIVIVLVFTLVIGLRSTSMASDAKDATAILDKAIKALGGEEKLAKAKAISWKAKGTISFGGNDNEVTTTVIAEGLDRYRQEGEGERDGNKFKFVTAVAGEKGWRDFGGNRMDLDKDGLSIAKRTAYLAVLPVTIVQLKSKDYKLDSIAEEKVGDKPVVGVKATGPDGKDFSIYFDKESGLPVKLVAKVAGFMGGESIQETSYSDYKDVDGIKKAMKISSKRNGEKFVEQQITEFKVLDKVDPKTFTDA